MSESKPYYIASTAAQTASHNGPAGSRPIFQTPTTITVVRGLQLFTAFAIIILAGRLIHGLVMDQVAFALVCGLFTFIVAGHALLSEKIGSCHGAYNYWATLSLDLLMAIFWLASMGATAALRATFIYSVHTSCYDDGSAVNSGHCVIYKRHSLDRRAAVLSQVGLAEMSAIAGLSALEMLLFIVSLAYLAHQVRLHFQSRRSATVNDATVEVGSQAQAMFAQQGQYSGGTAVFQPAHPQYANQTQHYPTQ